MRLRRPWLVVLAVMAMAAPAVAVSAPLTAVGHVHWLHDDNAWHTAVGLVDANGDGTPDPVVAGGDRTNPYQQCLVPPSGPWPPLHLAADTLVAPAVRLAALDGRDGTPLWKVEWAGGGVAAGEREYYELLQGLHTGDLDGDGTEDLLVLRQSQAADQSSIEQRLTMRDPASGEARWEVRRTLPGDVVAVQLFIPMAVFGEPGGLLAYVTIVVDPGPPPTIEFEAESRLVHLPPGEPPRTVVELPPGDAGLPVPYGDGYRLLSFPTSVTGNPPVVSVGLRAVDLTLDEFGDPVLKEAWVRPGGGGAPVRVTAGPEPAIVVGRVVDADNNANVAAVNLSDGQDRWVAPVNAGPTGGTFITVDITGDGTDDVIASPRFGPDPTGLFAGGFFPQLVALDGVTGEELWTRVDHAGKFRAWVLDTADVTGSGTPEVVAALTSQDGFPLCSQPADDPGVVAVYDLATGTVACRFHTDRMALALAAAQLDGAGGQEIIAPTLGGNVYAFTDADPGCGPLAAAP